MDARIIGDEVAFVGMVHRLDVFNVETLLFKIHDRDFTEHLAVGGPAAEVRRSVNTAFGADDDVACGHVDDRRVDGHLGQVALLGDEGRFIGQGVGGIEHIVFVAVVTAGEDDLVLVARVDSD